MKEPKIILFVQPKGGVGKSTILKLCALKLSQLNKKVGIVDWDNQKSSSNFLKVHVSDPNLMDFNSATNNNVELDYILVDTAGNTKNYDDIASHLQASHRIVIPCDASLDSLNGAKSILELLSKYESQGQALLSRAKLIWSKVRQRTRNHEAIEGYTKQFESQGLSVSKVRLYDRVHFQYATEDPDGLKALVSGYETLTISNLIKEIC